MQPVFELIQKKKLYDYSPNFDFVFKVVKTISEVENIGGGVEDVITDKVTAHQYCRSQ